MRGPGAGVVPHRFLHGRKSYTTGSYRFSRETHSIECHVAARILTQQGNFFPDSLCQISILTLPRSFLTAKSSQQDGNDIARGQQPTSKLHWRSSSLTRLIFLDCTGAQPQTSERAHDGGEQWSYTGGEQRTCSAPGACPRPAGLSSVIVPASKSLDAANRASSLDARCERRKTTPAAAELAPAAGWELGWSGSGHDVRFHR